jgi:hypothetical protein
MMDWSALNELIERCFGIKIDCTQSKKWIAGTNDGLWFHQG